MAILFDLLLISCVYFVPILSEINVTVSINLNDPPINILDDRFLSVTLDSEVIAKNFDIFDPNNTKLIKLTNVLKPAYLRVGGKMADRLIFSNDSEIKIENNFNYDLIDKCVNENIACQYIPTFIMTADIWKNMNNFAKKTGLKILFDLNALNRNEDGSWNFTNAEKLIAFSNDNDYDIDWQLGNEPNSFNYVFNYSVNASQLAEDFIKLRTILNKYPKYKNCNLVGPDITRPRPEHQQSAKYLMNFLLGLKDTSVLSAVSFHHYYFNGRTVTPIDYLNISTFVLLEDQINLLHKIVNVTGFKNVPVWLTETSDAYGGGAPGKSDTFLANYLWIDKLGLASKMGIKLVARQSLVYNNYALLNKYYQPNPGYWVTAIFKLLVGNKVLNCNISAPDTVRLYCHSASSTVSKVPTITIFGINLSETWAYINLQGIGNSIHKSYAYIVTTQPRNLFSTDVFVNGQLLYLSDNNDFPDLLKKTVDSSKPLMMQPYSISFWTIAAS